MSEINTQTAVDYFQLKLQATANAATAANTRKAIDAFARYTAETGDITLAELDGTVVRAWAGRLFEQGRSLSTVQAYAAKLSALVAKADREDLRCHPEAFAELSAQLRAMTPTDMECADADRIFDGLRLLVLKDLSANPALQLGRDMLLFAVLCGGLSLDRLTDLCKDEADNIPAAATAIAERYRAGRPRHLFPLSQSTRTPAQRRRAAEALIAEALAAAGLNITMRPGLAADLWAACALRCGVSAAEVAACLADSASSANPAVRFAAAAILSDDSRRALTERVADALTRDPANWYAMQFRPRVNYDSVASAIAASGATVLATYYPQEEIRRRIGRRMVRTERPVVPGLLFFKARPSALGPLYRSIGHLAWGYRTGRGPGAPYAVIPPADMELYRATIGCFDADTDVCPAGTIALQPGDSVRILAGPFAGLPATLAAVTRTGARTICRLHLMGTNAIEWTLTTSPRLLAPAP